MDKEYRFIGKLGRHINWNSLIPPLLDTWFAVSAIKDMQSDEIVVRVVDEPKVVRKVPYCQFWQSTMKNCDGRPLRKYEFFEPHFYCARCCLCTFSNCTKFADDDRHTPDDALRQPRDSGLSAMNAIEHPDVQALMKKVTEQQLEIDRLGKKIGRAKNFLAGAYGWQDNREAIILGALNELER